jgi:hypothetical protein
MLLVGTKGDLTAVITPKEIKDLLGNTMMPDFLTSSKIDIGVDMLRNEIKDLLEDAIGKFNGRFCK